MQRKMIQLDSRTGPPLSSLQARTVRTRRIRIAIPLVMFLGVIVLCTGGYVVFEWPRYGFLDALYMTVITVATVGYREVHPLSAGGRIWTIFVILSGLLTGGVVLSLIGAMVVEGQIRRIFGRRQLESKINGLSGHVIVCGCGRMGERVAMELDAAGRNVVVVDTSPERTAAVETLGLLYVLGDAQSEEVLEAAGISRARTIVSSLPTDAENLLVTLTASQMNPAVRIITRAVEGSTQRKLLRAGATRVVCPQIIGATRMVDIVLRPAVVDFTEAAHKGVDLEMDQLELSDTSELLGKSLRELDLPRRVGVHVVAIRRSDGETIYQPASDLTLRSGDTLILIGKRGAAAALQGLDLG